MKGRRFVFRKQLEKAAVGSVMCIMMSISSAWSQTALNPKDWFVLTPQSYWHYSGEGVTGGTIENDNAMSILSETKDVGGGILATRMKMTTDNPTDNRNGDEQFWYINPEDAEGKLLLYGLHNQKEDNLSSGKLSGPQDIIMETPILIGKNGQKIGDVVTSTSKTKVMTSSGQMDATVNSKTTYKEIISEYDTLVGKFVNILVMNIDIQVSVKVLFSTQNFDVMVGDYWLKENIGAIANNYKDLAVNRPALKIIDSGRIGAPGSPYIQPDSNILAHLMFALQTISDLKPVSTFKPADVNRDTKLGHEEAVYCVQKAANLRPFGISSSSFANGSAIPAKHSLDGGNLSPQLTWSNPPTDAQSYVLFADDPDAGSIFNHWIVYDIPSATFLLAENAGALNGVNLPAGAKHGITSWNNSFYEGPAPPSGIHRYFFILYALNTAELNPADASKSAIKAAMLGKVVGWTQVMGTYQK